MPNSTVVIKLTRKDWKKIVKGQNLNLILDELNARALTDVESNQVGEEIGELYECTTDTGMEIYSSMSPTERIDFLNQMLEEQKQLEE